MTARDPEPGLVELVEEMVQTLPGAAGKGAPDTTAVAAVAAFAAVTAAAPALARYLALLREANEAMNLVSRSAATPPELVFRHLFDALCGLAHLPERGQRRLRLLDVGSGGGFPAVPILLLRKDLAATLVESTKKKARFLEELRAPLELTFDVSDARFPDSFPMAKTPPFDLLTTRAVARAGRIVRSARPVLRRGARALLWTTAPLFEEALGDSGFHRGAFHETPGSERRGIGVIECST